MGDGGVRGEGRREAEGAGSGGAGDIRGGREEEAGRRGSENQGGRDTVVVADEQMREKMANRASHTATMGVNDRGKDGRELKEWGNAKRGGQTVLRVPGIGRGVPATRVSGPFFCL